MRLNLKTFLNSKFFIAFIVVVAVILLIRSSNNTYLLKFSIYSYNVYDHAYLITIDTKGVVKVWYGKREDELIRKDSFKIVNANLLEEIVLSTEQLDDIKSKIEKAYQYKETNYVLDAFDITICACIIEEKFYSWRMHEAPNSQLEVLYNEIITLFSFDFNKVMGM